MALIDWRNERSYTSCQDCGSWDGEACLMQLTPQRVGYSMAGDILDCKSFHYAPTEAVRQTDEAAQKTGIPAVDKVPDATDEPKEPAKEETAKATAKKGVKKGKDKKK